MSIEHGLTDRSIVLSWSDVETARVNNQFYVTGNDIVFPPVQENKNAYIVFLEWAEVTSGTFNILTNENTPVAIIENRNEDLNFQASPLRLDRGFKMVGTGCIAKGFFVKVRP